MNNRLIKTFGSEPLISSTSDWFKQALQLEFDDLLRIFCWVNLGDKVIEIAVNEDVLSIQVKLKL